MGTRLAWYEVGEEERSNEGTRFPVKTVQILFRLNLHLLAHGFQSEKEMVGTGAASE